MYNCPHCDYVGQPVPATAPRPSRKRVFICASCRGIVKGWK